MAVHFSSLNPLHPMDRAVARTPVVRQPSTVQKGSILNLSAINSPATPTPATLPPSTTTNPSNSGLNSLFPVVTTSTAPAAPPPPPAAPTPESVFGANPWVANPTGTGPTGAYTYNPFYFASSQTAAKVASMVGGQVVAMNSMSNARFAQNQPNLMVQLPSGALINPGLVASFYTHGYPQSMVDQMVANEVANVTKGV